VSHYSQQKQYKCTDELPVAINATTKYNQYYKVVYQLLTFNKKEILADSVKILNLSFLLQFEFYF